jgi:hypothetical protein
VLLGDGTKSGVPLALSGRVPVKVSLEGGEIHIGDRITLSSISGVGMKAGPLDPSVGIALNPYTESATTSAITVFLDLRGETDASAIAQAIASSSATTTEEALVAGSFASAAQAVKDALHGAFAAIGDLAQSGIRELGLAVHAGLGVFDNLITQNLTATVVNADTVNTKTLCIDGLCITKDQLQSILNGSTGSPQGGQGGAGAGAGGGSNDSGEIDNGGDSDNGTSTPDPDEGAATSTPDTEAPVITLSGNNPATISVGDTYTDLGATVTDNVDENLGFTVSLDGGVTTTLDQIAVDTSTSTSHTIVFSATDNAGNTGHATRTINVVQP